MKKLINDPEAVVREALEGMEAAQRGAIRVISSRTSWSAPTRR